MWYGFPRRNIYIVRKKRKLVIFTAPSGSGKTTIVTAVKNELVDTFGFSVSATTRKARPADELLKRSAEIDGKDYFFLSEEEFKEKILNKEFAEYEEVYKGKFYGTLSSEIDRILNAGKVALFDIDVKGAMRLKKKYGKNALFIYVYVPKKLAEERLQKRATEAGEAYQERIAKYDEESTYQQYSDVIIDNSLELATSVQSVKKMITRFLNN
jgi:guanylate kinase